MISLITHEFHVWQSEPRQVMLSNEDTKELLDFTSFDACINWLYLNGAREASRDLHHHIKRTKERMVAAYV